MISYTTQKELYRVTMLQSRTKYLEQNEVIQYKWTGKEKFGICFCVLFNCYSQSLSS